ncbi:DNA-binding response regulator, OmpR family, contains REC and winged-helix (wHTH) domain [Paenibacillus sp. UNCCL117]|uniref:response regulator transcription factor n=1 Tax=unclassified Paenibacillus TaxID=185978 RepID=UPI00088BB4AC|nr:MULTISPECIES: response regulator transcription factor [unclassified Paenibacillus]SDE41493.1 DNA-binding response regulator, OmpR family, contains REC and winged-helix (wHTH) domain [Paenibacillus sp. cl123]SFW65493.1 DNA-binding response regulator, OmpR family, contains REC and winged-helix (wHTH) domain [Paenibacillus sp. UNCCL117]
MPKVLIIEDEKHIAELERDYLESYGMESDIALTGEEGLQKALSHSYDLILLDLMLPGTDGLELCKKIRKDIDVPILIVTAKNEDIDKIRGFDRGADDYIVKPFNPTELVARVKAHIARYNRLIHKESDHYLIRVRDLVVDTRSRRVFVKGVERSMTAKEYELLVFLASNPNLVFSKDHLFERIWSADSIGDSSTITVHIRKIREKIEEEASNPQYIETIWGVGYRFNKE